MTSPTIGFSPYKGPDLLTVAETDELVPGVVLGVRTTDGALSTVGNQLPSFLGRREGDLHSIPQDGYIDTYIASGRDGVAIYDDFNRVNSDVVGRGWKFASGSKFFIESSACKSSGNGGAEAISRAFVGTDLEVSVKVNGSGSPGIFAYANDVSAPESGYFFQVAYQQAAGDINVTLRKDNVQVAAAATGVQFAGTLVLMMAFDGPLVICYVDGVEALRFNDPNPRPTGIHVGFSTGLQAVCFFNDFLAEEAGTYTWLQVSPDLGEVLGGNFQDLSVASLSATGLVQAAQSGIGDAFMVGNDLFIVDINEPNVAGLQGALDRSQASLRFGSAGPRLSNVGSTALRTEESLQVGGSLSVTGATTLSSSLGVGSTLTVGGQSTLTGLLLANGGVETPFLFATGRPGAQNASRYVGAVNGAAPTTGTHERGDFVVNRDGGFFTCISGGTPGTWIAQGSSPASTVVEERLFGLASVVGTGLFYARNDHTHGTPPTPVTSLTGEANGIGVSASTGAITITNLGLKNIIAGTGISQSKVGGDVTVTNTGVTSIVAGTGISRNVGTGAVTVTNTGVLSLAKVSANLTLSGSAGALTLTLTDTPTWTSQTVTGASTLGVTSVKGKLSILRTTDSSTFFEIDPAVGQITFPTGSISGDALVAGSVTSLKLSLPANWLAALATQATPGTVQVLAPGPSGYAVSPGTFVAGEIVTDDIWLGTAGKVWAGAARVGGVLPTSRLELAGGGTDASRGLFGYSLGVQTIRLSADGIFQLRTATTGRRINVDASVGIELYSATERTFFADLATGNLTLKGNVTATAGAIGGYTIGATDLNAGGTSATSVTLSSTAGIFLGGTAAAAPFRVSLAGRVDASNLHVTGGTLSVGSNFNVTNAGVLTASGVSISGTITASIFRTSATVGDGTAAGAGVLLDASGVRGFAANLTTPKTSISATTGLLTATEANISGAITATSGSFSGTITAGAGSVLGGFTSGATSLTATNVILDSANGVLTLGTGNAVAVMSRSDGFFAGAALPASAPFRVSTAGSLWATLGKIAGWDISAAELNVGGTTTASITLSTTQGIFLGGTSSAAPFRVSMAGALVATNATITGHIEANTGTFSGTLNGATGTFSGDLSGATVTGGTVRTAASGARIQMSGVAVREIQMVSANGNTSKISHFDLTDSRNGVIYPALKLEAPNIWNGVYSLEIRADMIRLMLGTTAMLTALDGQVALAAGSSMGGSGILTASNHNHSLGGDGHTHQATATDHSHTISGSSHSHTNTQLSGVMRNVVGLTSFGSGRAVGGTGTASVGTGTISYGVTFGQVPTITLAYSDGTDEMVLRISSWTTTSFSYRSVSDNATIPANAIHWMAVA